MEIAFEIELYDTHVLLLEHLSSIAPNKRDPLRELLEDLGDSPSICSLLGKVSLDFLFHISLETTFEIELNDTRGLIFGAPHFYCSE